MSPSLPSLPLSGSRRRVAGAGALTLAGAAAVEARHLRALAADPEHRRLSRPKSGRVARALSADGTSLHVEVFGPEGAPTIVLIPGWTELLTIFDPMTRELVDRGFCVVAYDLRGQGLSSQPPGHDHALARYGEDVEAVLATVAGSREDVLVAGHSLGAMSIAAWAAAHNVGCRVRAAALLNTGLEGVISASGVLPAVVPAAAQLWIGRHGFLANPLPLPPVSSFLSRSAIRYIAFGPHATRAQVAFFERMLIGCALPVRTAAGIAMADMDLLGDLQRLTVPALVVSGEADRLTPASHGRRIAEALPDLHRLVILPEIGHMAPLECPLVLCDALAELARAADLVPVARV